MKPGLYKILARIDALWRNMNLWLGQKQRHELVVWAFFLGYLFIGYQIYDDYGVSMDEPIQRKHGMVSLEYVNRQLGEPFNIPNIYNIDVQFYDHKDYGVIFQMFSYGLELMLNLKDSRDIFLLRHALVFLLFWISVVYFYKLLEYHFKDWKIALLGTVFLVLSPRIFANSFYNPKDIPLLSWCIISSYTFLKFLDYKNFKYAFLHGFACAMVINTRIVGVYIPVLTIGFLILSWLKTLNRKAQLKESLRGLTLFILLCIAFTLLFWPYLWSNPLAHFIYTFKSMSHFRWYNGIFFMGHFVYPDNLPWYYIPVWVGISTPLLYLILFLTGIIFIGQRLIKNQLKLYVTPQERNQLIFLSLFLIPLLSVIFLKSTLYNGWRHLYFIYPPLILIAICGVQEAMNLEKKINKFYLINLLKPVSYVILLIFTGKVAYDMIITHPFQNVYFNEVTANKAGKYFDLDYYGLGFRQGLEKLLTAVGDDEIKVAYSSFSGMNNEYIIPYIQRNRLREVSIDSADFFVTNYHLNPQSREQIVDKKFPYDQTIIGSIEVAQNDIIGIYMLNPENYLKGGVSKM